MSESLPSPPVSVSLPPPPLSVSLPVLPWIASLSAPPVKAVPPTMPTSSTCVAVASPSASLTASENCRLASSWPLLSVTNPMSEILMTSLSDVAASGLAVPGVPENSCSVVLLPPAPVRALRLMAVPVTPSVDTSSCAPSMT
ncbi:hypothetical protein D3C71_1590010 [compost metagenome]